MASLALSGRGGPALRYMRGSPGAATTPAKFHHGAARVLPSLSDDDEDGASGGEYSDQDDFGDFGELPDFNPRSAVSTTPAKGRYGGGGGGLWSGVEPDAAVDARVDFGRLRGAEGAAVPPSPMSDMLRLAEEHEAAIKVGPCRYCRTRHLDASWTLVS